MVACDKGIITYSQSPVVSIYRYMKPYLNVGFCLSTTESLRWDAYGGIGMGIRISYIIIIIIIIMTMFGGIPPLVSVRYSRSRWRTGDGLGVECSKGFGFS